MLRTMPVLKRLGCFIIAWSLIGAWAGEARAEFAILALGDAATRTTTTDLGGGTTVQYTRTFGFAGFSPRTGTSVDFAMRFLVAAPRPEPIAFVTLSFDVSVTIPSTLSVPVGASVFGSPSTTFQTPAFYPTIPGDIGLGSASISAVPNVGFRRFDVDVTSSYLGLRPTDAAFGLFFSAGPSMSSRQYRDITIRVEYVVPEPSSVLMVGMAGFTGVGAWSRRRRPAVA